MKSVIMEETSRGWGAPIDHRKLTPEQKLLARKMSLSLKKHGFVKAE